MSDYIYTRLDDLCVNGRGNYGLNASAAEEGSYRFLRITDILEDGTLNEDSIKYVDTQKAEDYILKPGDIVLARTGKNAGKCYLYHESDGELVYSGFLVRFRINSEKAYPLYLKYYFMSDLYKRWLHTMNGDGIRTNINARKLGTVKIPLPSLESQHIIAEHISVFDKKIKLNRNIIKNAEKHMQAMYEKLFIVNADPAWPIRTIEDMASLYCGKKADFQTDGKIPVYGSGGIIGRVNHSLCDKEAVLVPRKGSLGNIFYVSNPFWAIDTMYYAMPKQPAAGKYMYYFLKNTDLSLLDTGAAVPSIKSADLRSICIPLPDKQTLLAFENYADPFFRLIFEKKKENEKLHRIVRLEIDRYFF